MEESKLKAYYGTLSPPQGPCVLAWYPLIKLSREFSLSVDSLSQPVVVLLSKS